tara:strand:- start:27545 stop:28210 length:666 start_codon:yes stop_codon:yes gene_type:complete
MDQDNKKRIAAEAALDLIASRIKDDTVIGIGTGSTTNFFIQELINKNVKVKGAICSSKKSSELLSKGSIDILSLNEVHAIDFYVDGADEFNDRNELIKGGGGALTREKILADSSSEFICIVDDSKFVKKLGKFPLPIEVLELARSSIARKVVKLGGKPVWREDFVTDNGNQIIDVHNLNIEIPYELELKINNMPGVIENGIFAHRKANTIIISNDTGVLIK